MRCRTRTRRRGRGHRCAVGRSCAHSPNGRSGIRSLSHARHSLGTCGRAIGRGDVKIAVVAPCPVPYAVGGAEKVWWGLVTHLNDHTLHQADLIKLPSPEGDLRSLLASYEQFAKLDLSGFDLVVSGKYPAWMVDHPRHVVYMLHRLRGLYDAYPRAPEVPRELAADRGV